MILTTGHTLERKFLPRNLAIKKEETKNSFLIFLVDDDLFFLNSLSYFLTASLSSRFNIVTFSTAKDCIESLDQKPDIIVLDIFLSSDPPETNYGLDIIKKIEHFSPHSKVIALSSTANPDIISIMYDRGAYDYLKKDERAHSKLLKIIKTTSEWFSSEEELDLRANLIIQFGLILLIILIAIACRLNW